MNGSLHLLPLLYTGLIESDNGNRIMYQVQDALINNESIYRTDKGLNASGLSFVGQGRTTAAFSNSYNNVIIATTDKFKRAAYESVGLDVQDAGSQGEEFTNCGLDAFQVPRLTPMDESEYYDVNDLIDGLENITGLGYQQIDIVIERLTAAQATCSDNLLTCVRQYIALLQIYPASIKVSSDLHSAQFMVDVDENSYLLDPVDAIM